MSEGWPMVTAEGIDFFAPPRGEPAEMWTAIRCTGRYEDGRPCNTLLCRVDVAHWEELIAASPYIERKCKCGKVWHLAEYR